MLSRSSTYLSLIAQANHSVEWRVTVNGTVYDKNKLAASTGGGDALPRLTRNLFTGSTPTIGGCCAATFECTIFEASSNVPRMATVVPAYRLVNGNTTSEWITLGTFYIDTRSVNKSTGALSLYCYDRMLIADGAGGASYADVTGFDEWPQTMSAVVNEIASIMGVTVDSRTSINSGTGYNVDYPNDLTMREVLGYIAVAHCGNWCITPDNKLRLIPLTGGNGSYNLGSATGSLKAAEKLAGYTGVTVYWDDEDAYDAGTDTGMTIVADCPWATQETANGMLTAISGYQYQPYTASGAFADLALELGDSLTVGLTGQTITGPCFSIDITCDVIEAMDISAPGEAEVDHEYPYTDYVDRSLKRRVGLGQAYYGVTISRRAGIEIKRSDGNSEALFNSDLFTMRAKIDGVMKDRIYFDPVTGDYVFDGRLGADAVFTDSLYAEQGDIAELTVDRLSTSRRIRKYILQDVTDDNFVKIQDQYIQWITGTIVSSTGITTEDDIPLLTESGLVLTEEVGAAATEQARNRFGQGLYWQREPVSHTADGYPLDENGVQVYATTNVTEWPVAVYKYTELIKEQNAFEMQGQNYIPQSIYGAGDENGLSKGYIFKDENSFKLRYVSRLRKNVDITFSDEGFVDAMHRRLKSCNIDPDTGTVEYTVEGSESLYLLSFYISGDTVTYTWPDGYTCSITIPEDDADE